MDLSALRELEPDVIRATIPGWLSRFIADEGRAEKNATRMRELLADWSDETCRGVVSHLGEVGEEHRVYPAHPACRRLSREWCEDVLVSHRVDGEAHLQAAASGPTLLVCNHLSYFDANAIDAALAKDHALLADRVVAAAGPKVYQDLFRRFAAGCLTTLPVPQSTSLGHTAQLTPRELAKRAFAGLRAAAGALAEGHLVLIFPEGSRSRDGRLQPFLRGVHRWLSAVEDLRVVPTALSGTEAIMPVSSASLIPGRVTVQFGPALQVGVDGTAREVLAAAHRAVGGMLPDRLKPPTGLPSTA